jgi:hypothetical protein
MGRYCSLGEIDKNYFYIVLTASITLGIGFISMFLFKRNSNSGIVEGVEANKLLKTLSRYLGFDLCYIGELILRKLIKRKEETKDDQLINIDKKRSKIMDYIFSDSKNKFKFKDILYLILICLIILIDDFMIIIIKAKKNQGFIIFNEEYNSIEFFLLFIISIFIFKMIYYQHQHFSIILIILLEILRYLIKIFNDRNFSFLFSVFILQIIRSLCDAIFFGYIKGLMEYKYFSPFKCCYIFGFINTPIIIFLYLIVSHISFKNPNLLCSLIYNNSYYFDNYYSIFKNINFVQISSFLIYTICNGIYQLLINITIGQFTICHLFMPCQLTQLFINVYESFSNLKLMPMVIISGIFEIIFIFIFLEVIVLNCLELNRNIKKNIKNRAEEDVEISKVEERNNTPILINEDYTYNINVEEEEDNDSSQINNGIN